MRQASVASLGRAIVAGGPELCAGAGVIAEGYVVVAGCSSRALLDRFERQTAWPMLVLSLAILPLLIIPLVADLSPTAETTFFAIDWIIWAAFALEYGIRLYLAPAKRDFARHNIIDLVVVVVPFLRPLRVVRSARALRLLRAARGGVFLLRGIDAAQDVLRRHKLHYTLLIALVVVVSSALLVEEFERSLPDSKHQVASRRALVGGHHHHDSGLRRPISDLTGRARDRGRSHADRRRHLRLACCIAGVLLHRARPQAGRAKGG